MGVEKKRRIASWVGGPQGHNPYARPIVAVAIRTLVILGMSLMALEGRAHAFCSTSTAGLPYPAPPDGGVITLTFPTYSSRSSSPADCTSLIPDARLTQFALGNGDSLAWATTISITPAAPVFIRDIGQYLIEWNWKIEIQPNTTRAFRSGFANLRFFAPDGSEATNATWNAITQDWARLRIITDALPIVSPGEAFTFEVRATGGSGNYTWFMQGLPPGIYWTHQYIYSTGNEGAPAGTFGITIEVRDNGTLETVTRVLPLTVAGCGIYTATQEVLLDFRGVGGTFSFTIGNSTDDECRYSVRGAVLPRQIDITNTQGAIFSTQVVAPGAQRQDAAGFSGRGSNPYCSAIHSHITISAHPRGGSTSYRTIRVLWAPRPLQLLPDGTSFCQPDPTVDPPKPADFRPGQRADGSGVRG